MPRLCKLGGKTCANLLDENSSFSTLPTELSRVVSLSPQNTQCLHNFYTQFYTSIIRKITDKAARFSTVSTKTITTTTII